MDFSHLDQWVDREKLLLARRVIFGWRHYGAEWAIQPLAELEACDPGNGLVHWLRALIAHSQGDLGITRAELELAESASRKVAHEADRLFRGMIVFQAMLLNRNVRQRTSKAQSPEFLKCQYRLALWALKCEPVTSNGTTWALVEARTACGQLALPEYRKRHSLIGTLEEMVRMVTARLIEPSSLSPFALSPEDLESILIGDLSSEDEERLHEVLVHASEIRRGKLIEILAENLKELELSHG